MRIKERQEARHGWDDRQTVRENKKYESEATTKASEEWLLLAERGGRVKCFGWSRLQLWFCGVMSLAVSHASVSLSLAGTGGTKTTLVLNVCLCSTAHRFLLYFLQNLDRPDRIISVRPCLYSAPSSELLFVLWLTLFLPLPSLVSVSLCSCSSYTACSPSSLGRYLLVAPSNMFRHFVRSEILRRKNTSFEELHWHWMILWLWYLRLGFSHPVSDQQIVFFIYIYSIKTAIFISLTVALRAQHAAT